MLILINGGDAQAGLSCFEPDKGLHSYYREAEKHLEGKVGKVVRKSDGIMRFRSDVADAAVFEIGTAICLVTLS